MLHKYFQQLITAAEGQAIMGADTITMSTTLLVFVLGTLLTGLTAVGTVCAHILMNMKNGIAAIAMSTARIETSTTIRLDTLEKDSASLANRVSTVERDVSGLTIRVNNQRPTIINNNPQV